MSKIIESFVFEMRMEGDATRNVLRALPEDKFSWKPHPKSLSAGSLAKHIAVIPLALFELANRDGFDFSEGGPDFTPCASSAELMELFEHSLNTACEKLSAMPEERLFGNWKLMREGSVIKEIPRIGVIRTLMMSHLYHHRGQMTVYLRLLDVPVPSVYGPSADMSPPS